jgi:ATP-dependent helicase/nuclease subunit B
MNDAFPGVSTISLGRPFLDTLAIGLLSRFATPSATDLGKVTIILPTESARVGLLEALAKQASGLPLLLPRVYIFNDNLPNKNPRQDGDLDRLLPAKHFPHRNPITPTQRKLLLGTLILQWRKADPRTSLQSFVQSLKTASSLAMLVDELQALNVDYSCLDKLPVREHASHWTGVNKFLKILAEQWPTILYEKSLDDPFLYDTCVAQNLILHWRKMPPTNPIIAAGFTGNLPYLSKLLLIISSLPSGHVIVPSLDRGLEEEAWTNLSEEHPQFAINRLLVHLRIKYKSVAEWFDSSHLSCPPQRQSFLRATMCRVGGNDSRALNLKFDREALLGLSTITCPNTSYESKVIALVIKKFLSENQGNVGLITSDYQLSKQVSIELQRWKLDLQRPFRRSLRDAPGATFLQLVATMICLEVSPVSLLSVLKHSMCNGHSPPKLFKNTIKQLELRCLRGIRPEPGFSGIIASLKISSKEDRRLLKWLKGITNASQNFCTLIASQQAALKDLLNAHLTFSMWLCQAGGTPAAEMPWTEGDDRAVYQHLTNLSSNLDSSMVVKGQEYSNIFQTLLSDVTITGKNFQKYRVYTCTPEQAIFHTAELNILAGMNEDFWPSRPSNSSWLTNPMRQAVGLPSVGAIKGISAFEFYQNFSPSQVVLTRSKKWNGSETKPSYHFSRLMSTLQRANLYHTVDQSARWNALAQRLDLEGPSVMKSERPAPRPPRAARPSSLSATQIERWMKDPYGIFVSTILKIRPLRPIDAKLGPADYGQMVHAALENFVERHPSTLPSNALQELLKFGRTAFAAVRLRPEFFAFWWSRFERSAAYFIEEEKKHRPYHSSSHTEVWGLATLKLPAGKFTLTAKADRINLRRDGTMDIIDYKTGTPSTPRQILIGTKPQLLLEAIIALHGNYKNISARQVNSLISLRLNGGSPAGQYQSIEEGIPLKAEQFLSKLTKLICAFDDENTPYYFVPNSDYAPQHNEFEHLARVKEWLAAAETVETIT